ncbi:MAG: phosphotransferase family protein [Myxococcota bacterium]
MVDEDPLIAVARRVVSGGQLRRHWILTGGVSASMVALEVQTPQRQLRRLVVREQGAADWKPLAHDVMAAEYALHQALRRLAMPVPEVYLFDDSAQLLARPYLVMEFIEGTTEVDPAARPDAMRQMAAFLARLHTIELEGTGLPALPLREDPREGALEYLPADPRHDRLRTVMQRMTTVDPSSNRRSLVHGDFWPGNVLWRGGQIAAVIDWEDAAFGDPLSDLAACRVELLCRYDEAAMETFTEHYLALMDVDATGLPLWELYVSSAALATMGDWGLEPGDEANRRRETLGFMERAGRQLLSMSR